MFFRSTSELLYYAVVYKTTGLQDEESITHHTSFNLPKSEGINIHARCPLLLARWLSTGWLELHYFSTDDGIKQLDAEIHGSLDWVQRLYEKHYAEETPTLTQIWLCIVHGVKVLSDSESSWFKLWNYRPALGYPSEHVKVISFNSTCSCLASGSQKFMWRTRAKLQSYYNTLLYVSTFAPWNPCILVDAKTMEVQHHVMALFVSKVDGL